MTESAKFYVVRFKTVPPGLELDYACVPITWIVCRDGDNATVAFPNYTTKPEIETLVKKKKVPLKKWRLYPAIIKHEFDNYSQYYFLERSGYLQGRSTQRRKEQRKQIANNASSLDKTSNRTILETTTVRTNQANDADIFKSDPAKVVNLIPPQQGIKSKLAELQKLKLSIPSKRQYHEGSENAGSSSGSLHRLNNITIAPAHDVWKEKPSKMTINVTEDDHSVVKIYRRDLYELYDFAKQMTLILNPYLKP